MGKVTFGRPRFGKKSGQAGWMLGLCEKENGTKIDEQLQAGASGHQRVRQDIETNSDSGFLPKRLKTGRLKDKKEGLQGRKTKYCQMNLRWEDSGHRKVYGVSLERKCCKTEVRCQRKKETLPESTTRCTKRTSRAVGRGKMWKARKKGKTNLTGKQKRR